eukprot:TRINITY_DN796_c0_g1_i7.p1 TRINITY_DN796_c0_g1~~TRINITY_DN796_c0_g1_i7.p1  ORF type:complete len:111 (-),score=4.30 TRINITY_DN796_c0_g1_i7:444-776(-)
MSTGFASWIGCKLFVVFVGVELSQPLSLLVASSLLLNSYCSLLKFVLIPESLFVQTFRPTQTPPIIVLGYVAFTGEALQAIRKWNEYAFLHFILVSSVFCFFLFFFRRLL